MKAFLDNPLAALPAASRVAVIRLWRAYSHLTGLESEQSLCANVVEWAAAGVTPEDLLAAVATMTAPGAATRYRFASDVVAAFGELAAAGRDRRRNREQVERLRRENAQAERDRDGARAILADFLGRTAVPAS